MPHKKAKRSIREQAKAGQKPDLPPSQSTFKAADDDIPKSAARVLNAESIQKAWREKKRARGESEGNGGRRKKRKTDDTSTNSAHSKKSVLKIKPGESLRHFNRRVEDDMRPLLRTAMKNTTSNSKQKEKESQRNMAKSQPSAESTTSRLKGKGHKSLEQDGAESEGPPTSRRLREDQPRDFARASSAAPKRLNDIAQAPPELKVAPRMKRLAANWKSSAKEDRSGDGDADDDKRGVVSAQQKRMMELEREKAIARYRALKEARLKGQARERAEASGKSA